MASNIVEIASDSMETETHWLLSFEPYSHQEALLRFLVCVLVQPISWGHLFWCAPYQGHLELRV